MSSTLEESNKNDELVMWVWKYSRAHAASSSSPSSAAGGALSPRKKSDAINRLSFGFSGQINSINAATDGTGGAGSFRGMMNALRNQQSWTQRFLCLVPDSLQLYVNEEDLDDDVEPSQKIDLVVDSRDAAEGCNVTVMICSDESDFMHHDYVAIEFREKLKSYMSLLLLRPNNPEERVRLIDRLTQLLGEDRIADDLATRGEEQYNLDFEEISRIYREQAVTQKRKTLKKKTKKLSLRGVASVFVDRRNRDGTSDVRRTDAEMNTEEDERFVEAQEQVNSLYDRVDQITKEVHERDCVIDKLRRECQAELQKTEALQVKHDQHSAEAASTSQELRSAKTRITSLEEDLAQAHEKERRLSVELAAANGYLTQLQDTEARLSAELVEVNSASQASLDDNNTLRRELERVRLELDATLTSTIPSSNGDADDDYDKHRDHEERVQSLMEKIQQTWKEGEDKLAAARQQWSEKESTMKGKLGTRAWRFAIAQKNCESLRKQLSELRSERTPMLARNKDLEESLATTLAQLERTKLEMKSLDQSAERAQKSLASVTAERNALQDELTIERSQTTDTSKNSSELRKKIINLEKTIRDLKEQAVSAKDNAVMQVRSEKSAWAAREKDLRDKCVKLEEDLAASKAENEDLERSLQGMRRQLGGGSANEFSATVSSGAHDYESSTRTMQLQKQVVQLQSQVVQLQTENQSLSLKARSVGSMSLGSSRSGGLRRVVQQLTEAAAQTESEGDADVSEQARENLEAKMRLEGEVANLKHQIQKLEHEQQQRVRRCSSSASSSKHHTGTRSRSPAVLIDDSLREASVDKSIELYKRMDMVQNELSNALSEVAQLRRKGDSASREKITKLNKVVSELTTENEGLKTEVAQLRTVNANTPAAARGVLDDLTAALKAAGGTGEDVADMIQLAADINDSMKEVRNAEDVVIDAIAGLSNATSRQQRASARSVVLNAVQELEQRISQQGAMIEKAIERGGSVAEFAKEVVEVSRSSGTVENVAQKLSDDMGALSAAQLDMARALGRPGEIEMVKKILERGEVQEGEVEVFRGIVEEERARREHASDSWKTIVAQLQRNVFVTAKTLEEAVAVADDLHERSVREAEKAATAVRRLADLQKEFDAVMSAFDVTKRTLILRDASLALVLPDALCEQLRAVQSLVEEKEQHCVRAQDELRLACMGLSTYRQQCAAAAAGVADPEAMSALRVCVERLTTHLGDGGLQTIIKSAAQVLLDTDLPSTAAQNESVIGERVAALGMCVEQCCTIVSSFMAVLAATSKDLEGRFDFAKTSGSGSARYQVVCTNKTTLTDLTMAAMDNELAAMRRQLDDETARSKGLREMLHTQAREHEEALAKASSAAAPSGQFLSKLPLCDDVPMKCEETTPSRNVSASPAPGTTTTTTACDSTPQTARTRRDHTSGSKSDHHRVDALVAQYLKRGVTVPSNFARHSGDSTVLGRNSYVFGTRRIELMEVDRCLVVIVGGGYLLFDEFCARFCSTEMRKMVVSESRSSRVGSASPRMTTMTALSPSPQRQY